MDINSRIKEYLVKNEISQTELANKLGISSTSLSRSLNSDDLKVSLLIRICQVLKIQITAFFDGSEAYNKNELEQYILKQKDLELKQTVLLNQLNETNEQIKDLLKLVAVLFSTESTAEAEKARLVLKSLVDFFRVEAPDIKSTKKTTKK